MSGAFRRLYDKTFFARLASKDKLVYKEPEKLKGFGVKTHSGVWAEKLDGSVGFWERKEDIPPKLADRFENYFDTEEYIETRVIDRDMQV